MAVSKQQAASSIRRAYAAGLRHFGENYVQEAVAKMDELADLDIEWHFIGGIQSNKTRIIAERFQWVHTVDRARIAERLNDQRPAHAPRLDTFIQVNLANEPQKSGVSIDELPELARFVSRLPRLTLRGLMFIPTVAESESRSARAFARLRELRDVLTRSGIALDSLSMGMSADFEVAIEEGATCVRIGSALFGPRAIRAR